MILEIDARGHARVPRHSLEALWISRGAPVTSGDQQLRGALKARERLNEHVEALPLHELAEKDQTRDAWASGWQRAFGYHRRAHPVGPEQVAGDHHLRCERRVEQIGRVCAAVRDVGSDPTVREVARIDRSTTRTRNDRYPADTRGAGERRTVARVVQVDHIGTPSRETHHPREHVDRVEREGAPRERAASRPQRLDAPTGCFVAELAREGAAQDEAHTSRGGELCEIERIVDGADAQISAVQLNQNPQVCHGHSAADPDLPRAAPGRCGAMRLC
jgi:hypothetical protein